MEESTQDNTEDDTQDSMESQERILWKNINHHLQLQMKYQDEYYNAISKCHVNGNSTFFIEFMLKQIDSVLEEIATQINEDSEQLSDCVRKLLDVMEYDVAYTSNQLMEKLELKSREGFRRNYLKHTLELNLVRMTIPDKPNSKNQRYIKK